MPIKMKYMYSIPVLSCLIKSLKIVVFPAPGGETIKVVNINYATSCGVKGIFTAHGETLEDINTNLYLRKIIELNIFEIISILYFCLKKIEGFFHFT